MENFIKQTWLILLLAVGLTMPSVGQWKTVIHKKQKYVYSSQIPSYYHEFGFTRSMPRSNKIRFTAKNKMTIIDFTLGSQEVFLNGIKFDFAYPVIIHNGKFLISQIDLVKLINPILRPSYIKNGSILKTVIIDPGHGGKDPGTTNRYGYEKNFNLALAKRLRYKLVNKGFNVVMTRTGDQTISLSERVTFANRYQDAIFVSLHFNSGGAGQAYGIETFTLSPAGVAHYGRGLRAKDLEQRAGNAQDSSNIALATAIHGRAIRKLNAKDRGIRRARFEVITGIKHPGILFEGGFMSNYKEASLIRDPSYQDTMAQAIFEGIVLYKTATEKNRLR